MGDNGLPDHIYAIKQLAVRYPQIDLNHVGIYGHSGGGFSSTDAILRHPDFFKVAVSGAGNHYHKLRVISNLTNYLFNDSMVLSCINTQIP